MIPYLVPGTASAKVLRQITPPRAVIVAAVNTFRSAAEATGTTSWHLARLRLPGAYEAMLDQVEVTVAEQALPRLQAVGSAQAMFPFLYELSWGPRESFSPARLRHHGPRCPAIQLLPGPALVTAWARRNRRHGTALAGLANRGCGPLDLQPPAP